MLKWYIEKVDADVIVDHAMPLVLYVNIWYSFDFPSLCFFFSPLISLFHFLPFGLGLAWIYLCIFLFSYFPFFLGPLEDFFISFPFFFFFPFFTLSSYLFSFFPVVAPFELFASFCGSLMDRPWLLFPDTGPMCFFHWTIWF